MKNFLRYIMKFIALIFKRIIVRLRFEENIEMLDEIYSPLSKVLVIAPHPDDEVFGLGGFLSHHFKHFAHSDQPKTMSQIFICYLTDGEASLKEKQSAEVARRRISISNHVLNKLLIPSEQVLRLHLPDGALSDISKAGFSDQLLDKLSDFVHKNHINVIMTTHQLDYWPTDHVVAYRLAEIISRRCNCHLYAYWVWSWYNQSIFRLLYLKKDNFCRIPIDQFLREKQAMIKIYMRQKTENGSPWSGVLPRIFMKSNTWKFEVIEKITY